MIYRCLIFLLLLMPEVGTSQTDYSAGGATAAMDAVDPLRAAAMADSLEATGIVSPELYLLQGNAHFAAGHTGRAILAYERGLRLQPAHSDLQNNLAFVREQARIEDATVGQFFLVDFWNRAGAALGTTLAYSLSLLFWWLAVAGALWWYLRRTAMDERKRFALLPAATLCAVIALLLFALGRSRTAYLGRADEGVLLEAATLRVAPTAGGSVEAQLPEGVRLYITDRVDRYIKIQLADGRSGYLEAESVGVI